MESIQLCEFCQGLDFEPLLIHDKSIPVGTRYQESPGNDCKLCNLFHNFTPPLTHRENCGCIDRGYHLKSIPIGGVFNAFMYMKEAQIQHTEFAKAIVPLPGCLGWGQHCPLQGFTAERGLIVNATLTPAPLPFALVSQVLNESIYRYLRSCIDECMQEHTHKMFSQQGESAVTKLIDCYTRNIIDGSLRHPYVALSYVWGKSRLMRVINNRLPTQVPNVIEDAMAVTKALGFRYLWVDQFCIDQQDSDRKIVEIRKMNMIYNTAELTIVAAAGSDADYGLPGVGNRPRKLRQQHLKVRGGSLLVTPVHPYRTINQSIWNTRGWTYQEALFSKRVLVFTDDETYYECPWISRCETIRCDMESRGFPVTFHHYFIPNGPLQLSKFGELFVIETFLRHVERFTERKLTVANDSLYAFAGILSVFETIPGGRHNTVNDSNFFKPVTETQPETNRIFGVVCNEGKSCFRSIWGIPFAIPPKGQGSIDLEKIFIFGLSWCHKGYSWDRDEAQYPTITRRSEFPSWSWAGWGGAVVYPWMDDLRYVRSPTSVINQAEGIHFLDSKKFWLMRTSTRTASVFDSRSTQSRKITFKGSSVPADKISVRRKPDGLIEWSVCGLEAKLYMSHRPLDPDLFLKSLFRGNHSIIFLYWHSSCRSSPYPRLAFLIVQHDSVTTRVGLMEAHEHPGGLDLKEFTSNLSEPKQYCIS